MTANRTFYVAPTGSDSNSGVSASSPFATIQKAIDTITRYQSIARGVIATIQLANGTYTVTAATTLNQFAGGGQILIQGDTATPGNVTITTATAIVQFFLAKFKSDYVLQGFTLTASAGSPSGLFANGGYVSFQNIDFGAGLSQHIRASFDGYINGLGDYTISGGGSIHISATNNGTILIPGSATVTVSGTPAFSGAFANCIGVSLINTFGTSFSGAATGTRYVVTLNGVITTNGGGANFFPGNGAGSSGTGGQYA